MYLEFFNMLVEPLYCGFSNYDPTGNLLQFSLLFMLVITAISWLKYILN